DARFVLLEQVRLNACVLALHCWRSPSRGRIGESLEAHRSRHAEIAEYQATAAAQHEADAAPPIRVSSTQVCKRPSRRAAEQRPAQNHGKHIAWQRARARRTGDETGSKSVPRSGVGGQYVSASSRAWISRISMPLSSRCVAKLWRSECRLTRFLMPAAAAVSWNRRLSWRVVRCNPRRRPGNSQRSCGGTPAS